MIALRLGPFFYPLPGHVAVVAFVGDELAWSVIAQQLFSTSGVVFLTGADQQFHRPSLCINGNVEF